MVLTQKIRDGFKERYGISLEEAQEIILDGKGKLFFGKEGELILDKEEDWFVFENQKLNRVGL